MTEITVGDVLTTADPEPPVGTIVLCLGEKWGNVGNYWVAMDRDGQKSWKKIAGNYGPVTVVAVPRRRCTSEACDEYDGIHCYGDGCAMVSDERERYEDAAQGLRGSLLAMVDAYMPQPSHLKTAAIGMVNHLADTVELPSPLREMRRAVMSPGCYEASWGWVHSRPSCRCSR